MSENVVETPPETATDEAPETAEGPQAPETAEDDSKDDGEDAA